MFAERKNISITKSYLHIHVPVYRHQVALVLHTPLQLNHHWFASQAVQKWFWVQR